LRCIELPFSAWSGSSSLAAICRFIVVGRAAPRCAWSFWEDIGWKKACEVSEGTWLLLVELGGRAPALVVEAAMLLLPALRRLPDSPRLNG
jgi:hypothetical protein